MVDSRAVRRKLSAQLKIDLEPHERVHLQAEPVNFGELTEKEIESIMESLGDSEQKSEVVIKKLGEYIARISVRGGYSIPLKFEIMKR
jgi:hypothetical protein